MELLLALVVVATIALLGAAAERYGVDRGLFQKEAVRQMHGYELLVPFLIADRERQANEARLAHLAADDVPFQHQTTGVEDAETGLASSASTIPALGRFINRFTGRPKTA